MLSASQVSAAVAVLHHVELAKPELYGDLVDYDIRYRGRAGWSGIRKADKTIVVEGLASREAVAAWLRNPTAQAA